jgi:hypothetical protein
VNEDPFVNARIDNGSVCVCVCVCLGHGMVFLLMLVLSILLSIQYLFLATGAWHPRCESFLCGSSWR